MKGPSFTEEQIAFAFKQAESSITVAGFRLYNELRTRSGWVEKPALAPCGDESNRGK